MNQDSPTRPSRRYRTLWIMIALFGSPYLIAGLFYFSDDLRESLPLANKGDLIAGLEPLPSARLVTFSGPPLETDSLRGQWLLLYENREPCDGGCEETLFLMRQIRLAMGRERFRIERLALLADSTPERVLATLYEHQPGMHLARYDAAPSKPFVEPLERQYPGRGRLFVIDPLGRPVLSYEAPLTPKDVLADLKRLIGGRGRG